MQHATQPLVWLKTPVEGLSLRRQRHLFESILKCVDNGGHLFEWTIKFRSMFVVVATNIIECREVNRTQKLLDPKENLFNASTSN